MKTIKLLFLFLLGALSMQAQESETFYHEGTIIDQDGNPIEGAIVCIFCPNFETGVNDLEYYGTSDAEGHYVVKVENCSDYFRMSVECNGFPIYVVNSPFKLGKKYESLNEAPKNIILWNRLEFKKDQKASIILPDTPNPTWGRYYRLDHLESPRTIVFVREEAPQANVPYVIFPNNDLSIDLSKFDLANLPEPGFVPVDDEPQQICGLYGSYRSVDVWGMFFDNTLDCSDSTDRIAFLPRLGAFRAYLYASVGTETVFIGEQTGIFNVTSTPDNSILFNLQGRRLATEPKQGVFIKNGKKVVK